LLFVKLMSKVIKVIIKVKFVFEVEFKFIIKDFELDITFMASKLAFMSSSRAFMGSFMRSFRG